MPQTLSSGAANEDGIFLEDWDFPSGDKLAELEQTEPTPSEYNS